jgi:putative pyruvate formate lyase activating enzyme
LKLLDGIVDIYMPDFKFWSPETAGEMCTAPDYPERARESLKEMHRQVGDLQVNREGVATRGLLVRHLVMPNDLAGSRKIFDFIAREISKNTYINVMGQYHPSGYAVGRKDIGRRPSGKEMIEAMQAARNAGLNRLDERRARWFEF